LSLISIWCCLLSCLLLIACAKRQDTAKKPTAPAKKMSQKPNAGAKLREMALNTTPEQIKVPRLPGQPFAAFMETGYPDACVTLSMIGDGTTSFYFSNGGGIIGGGQHESVRNETFAFLKLAASYVKDFEPTSDLTQPPVGVTRFIFKTPEGYFASQEDEDVLLRGSSPIQPLFVQAHRVITKFREAAEARRRQEQSPAP